MSVAIHAKEDLRNPQLWDRVKDQLSKEDKRSFLEVYFLQTDDPIVHCRKAELLISLNSPEDDALAYELVKDNPEVLAYGLKAKALLVMKQTKALEALLEQDFPVCRKEQDFEGFIHFQRAKASLLYKSGLYEEALNATLKAQTTAECMKLTYLQKVLSNDAQIGRRQLGFSEDVTLLPTGNANLSQNIAFTRYRSQLITSDFDTIQSENLAQRFKDLALALEAKQDKRYSLAMLKAKDLVFPELEFQVHAHLLRLELFGRTNDHIYTAPKDALKRVHELIGQLDFKLQVLSDCAKLYPLGVTLAGLDAEIAVVKNINYRDGIHYAGKVFVVPNEARRLLIQDDLENTSYTTLMHKTHRFRMNQKLREIDLTVHHLVSQDLINRAKEQLEYVI